MRPTGTKKAKIDGKTMEKMLADLFELASKSEDVASLKRRLEQTEVQLSRVAGMYETEKKRNKMLVDLVVQVFSDEKV